MQTASDGLFRRIRDAAIAQGWRVDKTAKHHWRFLPPVLSLPAVVTSGTPSDFRAVRNFLAAMRRSGLVFKP